MSSDKDPQHSTDTEAAFERPYLNEKDVDTTSVESNVSDEAHRAVTRSEAINETLNELGAFTVFGISVKPLKWLLLFCLFLVGYTSGLDGIMSGSFQQVASSAFKENQASGSINTAKGIIAACVLVPYARLSDRFGRMEIWLLSTLIFTVGRIVTAATPTFGGLFAGTIIWECGYAGFRMLATAMLADFSNLKDRTFVMNIFLIPIIINLWVSGDIVSGIEGGPRPPFKWRWGYGIGCITVPFTIFLLAIPFFTATAITYRRKNMPPFKFRKRNQSWGGAIKDLIMEIDLIGMLLFAAALALVLIPLTIAGGAETKWRKAYIIALICIGGAGFFPAFLLWEYKFSTAPFIPMQRLETTFWAALAIEFFWRLGLSIELNNIRNVLLLGFNQTPKSAQRLGQFYDFMQGCTNIVIGIILHFLPYPKISVFFGSIIGLVGMCIMYKYRTAYEGGISGFIGAEVMVGICGGMVRYPMYTLVHAGIPHNNMAVATGFMFSMYQVGAAVGAAIGTAVWTNKLPKKLNEKLGPKLGQVAYKSPNAMLKYKLGTPQRDGMLDAYSYVQRLLVICSISFAALVVILCFFLRGYTVEENEQSLTEEEREAKRAKLREGSVARRALRWVTGI